MTLATRTARLLRALEPPWAVIESTDPLGVLIVDRTAGALALWVGEKPEPCLCPSAVIEAPGDALKVLESWGLLVDGRPVEYQWTPEQRRALEMVALGCTLKVVSERLGRNRRTLQRWREDPLFARAWERVRAPDSSISF